MDFLQEHINLKFQLKRIYYIMYKFDLKRCSMSSQKRLPDLVENQNIEDFVMFQVFFQSTSSQQDVMLRRFLQEYIFYMIVYI